MTYLITIIVIAQDRIDLPQATNVNKGYSSPSDSLMNYRGRRVGNELVIASD